MKHLSGKIFVIQSAFFKIAAKIMTGKNELGLLSLERLATLCAEHTLSFESGEESDPCYCYELSHRAVLDIPGGWSAVDQQYRPWIRRVILRYYRDNPAEIEDLVQETLITFSQVVTSETWSNFPNLSAVLGFLKACARNAALNRRRDLSVRAKRELVLEDVSPRTHPSNRPEQVLLDEEAEAAYVDWRSQVSVRIYHKCNDEYDKKLIFWWYELELSAKEICSRHPHVFSIPQDVYKRVRNLKDRIARDPELVALLESMP